MFDTCGIIRSNRRCAYLVLPRERHVDVLSSNFPLTELFTVNYAAQPRGGNRSLCCIDWDPPDPATSRPPVRLNRDCSEESDWSPCVCVCVCLNVTTGRPDVTCPSHYISYLGKALPRQFPIFDVLPFVIFSLNSSCSIVERNQ